MLAWLILGIIIKNGGGNGNPSHYSCLENPMDRGTWQATVQTVSDFIFGAPKSLQMVIAAMKLKDAYSLEAKLWPT